MASGGRCNYPIPVACYGVTSLASGQSQHVNVDVPLRGEVSWRQGILASRSLLALGEILANPHRHHLVRQLSSRLIRCEGQHGSSAISACVRAVEGSGRLSTISLVFLGPVSSGHVMLIL